MKWLWLFVCALPIAWEVWNDRNGETKKDKRRDLIVFSAFTLAACLLGRVFGVNPLRSAGMTFGWRVLLFDYVINRVLWLRGVIERPEARDWFKYTGYTASLDQRPLWIKLGPWGRLVVKGLVFCGCFYAFVIG